MLHATTKFFQYCLLYFIHRLAILRESPIINLIIESTPTNSP